MAVCLLLLRKCLTSNFTSGLTRIKKLTGINKTIKVHKSKLPLNTTKDTTIELTFTKNELKISYCQESCGRKIGDQIDVFKKPENKNIFIGKLHETVFHVAPERLRMLSGFNSIVTSVKVNGEKKNLWREASLMR